MPDPRLQKLRYAPAPHVCHLPAIMRTFDQVDGELKQILRDLGAGLRPWPLFLRGLAGVGKTCAALCLADFISASQYFTESELCERMRAASMRRLHDRYGEPISLDYAWRQWANVELAILDEVGAPTRPSDHHREVIQKALDLRCHRPAIFISNHSGKAILAGYHDRIISRLAAGTRYELIGPDRRVMGGYNAREDANG